MIIMSKKLEYSYIKKQFEKEGYTLLSTEYVNNKIKLAYRCPEGHCHSIKWNDFQQGYRCPICANLNKLGAGNGNWKGGVRDLQIPLYETYAHQFEKYQIVYKIKKNNFDLLGIHCMYCNQIFVPKVQAIKARINTINGVYTGERNLYCSDNCKKACPTFGKQLYPEGFKPATSREVQPELRKLVLARDDYRCIKCGKGLEESELHCHHIDPVSQNPIESADMDNCVILCKECHKEVHTLSNCKYIALKCN